MGNGSAIKYIKSHKIRPGLLILALIVFVSILSHASVVASAIDVTLAWDSSNGADGYRLFYRAAYEGIAVRNGTTTTVTLYEVGDRATNTDPTTYSITASSASFRYLYAMGGSNGDDDFDAVGYVEDWEVKSQ